MRKNTNGFDGNDYAKEGMPLCILIREEKLRLMVLSIKY